MAECGAKAAFCECTKSEGHVEQGDLVHLCEDGSGTCGGKWKGEPGMDSYDIVRFPYADGMGDAYNKKYGLEMHKENADG